MLRFQSLKLMIAMLSVCSALSLQAEVLKFKWQRGDQIHFEINQEILALVEQQVIYSQFDYRETYPKNLGHWPSFNINTTTPENLGFIISKTLFLSTKAPSFFQEPIINSSSMVEKLLRAEKIERLDHPTKKFYIETIITKFGIPFPISFNFEQKFLPGPYSLQDQGIKELNATSLIEQDYSDFSRMGHQSKTKIFVFPYKGRTLLVCYQIATIDNEEAGRYFQYPPLITIREEMRRQLEKQIYNIVRPLL